MPDSFLEVEGVQTNVIGLEEEEGIRLLPVVLWLSYNVKLLGFAGDRSGLHSSFVFGDIQHYELGVVYVHDGGVLWLTNPVLVYRG